MTADRNELPPSDEECRSKLFARELILTAKELRRSFDRAIERAGGSLGTWIVLSTITEDGPTSQAALASRAHLDGATITYHIDRAEKQGLVHRAVDDVDHRVKRLRVTAAGERLHRQLGSVASTFEMELLADLTVSEQAELRVTLAKLRANLCAISRAE